MRAKTEILSDKGAWIIYWDPYRSRAVSNIASGIGIDEAKRLYNKIQVQALLIQNPTLLEYRERGIQSLEAHRLMAKSKPECLSTIENTSDEADSALEKSVSLCSVVSVPSNSPASDASQEDDSFAVKTRLLLRCKAH